jgi:hypothetical protein
MNAAMSFWRSAVLRQRLHDQRLGALVDRLAHSRDRATAGRRCCSTSISWPVKGACREKIVGQDAQPVVSTTVGELPVIRSVPGTRASVDHLRGCAA